MKHGNNHWKPLNIIKEIQQKERGAWMDLNEQDWNGLNLDNAWKVFFFFQVYGKSTG